MAPPLVSFMSDCDRLTAEDLECVQYFIVAAAPVGVAIMDKIRKKMPNVMFVEGETIEHSYTY